MPLIENAWWPEITDEEAVTRCLDGDDDAYRVLYERYYGVLFGTACLMTNDRALAQELVQEAFFAGWRRLRDLERGASFKPWIVHIVVNLVLAQRRKGQLPTVSLEDLAVQPSGGAIDHQVAHEMDARQLLQSLTDDDLRQPILLRYYAELTVPEIAKVLGVPEGTVKSRLHRAMGLLRREAKRGAVG